MISHLRKLGLKHARRLTRLTFGSVRATSGRRLDLRPPLRIGALALAGFAVASCTVLTSTLPEQLATDRLAPTGVFYALPRGVVSVTLSVKIDDGRYYLDVGEPEFSPDPSHRYLLQYRPLPNYNDSIMIEVSDLGLLKKAYVTAVDDTPTVIANLAKSLTAILGYEVATIPTGAALVSKVTIDLSRETEVARAASELNAAMRTHAARIVAICREQEQNTPACQAFGDVAGGARRVRLAVEVPPSMPAGAPSNCAVGLCYRPKEPYIASFGLGDIQHVKIVELPNRAAPIELDINRAFFVKKMTNIDFDANGFLSQVKIEKDSELLAVSKLPLDVISAVGAALAIRVNVINQQTNIAKKKAALLEAEAKLRSQRAGREIH